MAAAAPASPDESGLVVALAFGSIALTASGVALWRMTRGGAAADAAADAAAGAPAAAAKPRHPRFNLCAGVFAASLAATAYSAWAVSRASSLRPYDPYAELGLPFGASEKDVTQAYRRLSKTAHPDRGGDKAAFHALERAHRALTDPAAMANLRDYGNPEGVTGRAAASVASNPALVFVTLAVLAAIVYYVYSLYAAADAKRAAAEEGAAAGGAGAAAPSSAKELKIARQKAFMEQEQRRREREARKHGSASPPPAAAAAPVEKMD